MKLKFSLVLFLFVANCYNCLSQEIIDDSNRLYKVVNIDSTDHNYYIFVSKNGDTFELKRTVLTKRDDCNNYLSFNNPNQDIICIISEKTYNCKRNIYAGDTINLTLKQVFGSSKTFPSAHAFAHVGFGDYLIDSQSDMLFYSNQVMGLFYAKDSVILQRFYSQRDQLSYFDSQMLNIWMKFSNSKTCYLKWLNSTIENSKLIEISVVNDSFILYKDSDCLNTLKISNVEDFTQNGLIKVRLYYQKKHHAFIQIDDSLSSFYGWVKLEQK
jgi:hypothetical protein